MGDFHINLFNTDTDPNVSDFYDILSSNVFSPYILQPSKLPKFLKSSLIKLNLITFSGNLTLQMSDHLPQFLILKDFYHKTLINSINFFERNDDDFKNVVKDIPRDNVLWVISPQVPRSICFFQRVNILLDEHVLNHKLSKKDITES